jgi:hypothetical protein
MSLNVLILPQPPSVPRSQRGGGGSGGMRAMQYKPQAMEAARPSTAREPNHVLASHAVDRNNPKNKENIGPRIFVKGFSSDALKKEFGLKREFGLNAQEGTLKREVYHQYLSVSHQYLISISSVSQPGHEMLMHVQAF